VGKLRVECIYGHSKCELKDWNWQGFGGWWSITQQSISDADYENCYLNQWEKEVVIGFEFVSLG